MSLVQTTFKWALPVLARFSGYPKDSIVSLDGRVIPLSTPSCAFAAADLLFQAEVTFQRATDQFYQIWRLFSPGLDVAAYQHEQVQAAALTALQAERAVIAAGSLTANLYALHGLPVTARSERMIRYGLQLERMKDGDKSIVCKSVSDWRDYWRNRAIEHERSVTRVNSGIKTATERTTAGTARYGLTMLGAESMPPRSLSALLDASGVPGGAVRPIVVPVVPAADTRPTMGFLPAVPLVAGLAAVGLTGTQIFVLGLVTAGVATGGIYLAYRAVESTVSAMSAYYAEEQAMMKAQIECRDKWAEKYAATGDVRARELMKQCADMADKFAGKWSIFDKALAGAAIFGVLYVGSGLLSKD